MKKLLIIAVVLIAASCGSKEDNPENAEQIKKQISEYKGQVVDLNKKITQLEEKLKLMEGTGTAMIPVTIEQIEYQEFNHFIQVNGNVEAVFDAFISPEIN
jgi:outer membrane murein-binding lipoprotein Lpp